MYVAGVLEYERPCLCPLYKFMSLHSRDSVQPVPAYVAYFLQYLSQQLQGSTHCECAAKLYPDAQASALRTGIGGWFPRFGPSGEIDTRPSERCSVEMTREEWPWICEKSSKPSLITSSLEALAVLVGLLYHDSEKREHRSSVRAVPTITDNRGNGSALNTLMSTKYPANAVIMELASNKKKKGYGRRLSGHREREPGSRLPGQRCCERVLTEQEIARDPQSAQVPQLREAGGGDLQVRQSKRGTSHKESTRTQPDLAGKQHSLGGKVGFCEGGRLVTDETQVQKTVCLKERGHRAMPSARREAQSTERRLQEICQTSRQLISSRFFSGDCRS